MTVANATGRTQLVATSGQTLFTSTFPIDDQSFVSVYKRSAGSDPNDSADLLTIGTEYTVSGVGGATFNITLVSGATTGDIVTLVNNQLPERDTSFVTASTLTAANLNTELDHLILIFQNIFTDVETRGVLYQHSAVIADKDRSIPILSAEQTWAMNAAGTAIVAVDFPADGAASKVSTYVTMTDATAEEPNSYPLSALGDGFLANDTGSQALQPRTITGTANQINVSNGSGVSGNPTLAIASNPLIPGTAGMGIPQGTTAQRVVPSSGIGLRYNTDLLALEFYTGTDWAQVQDSDLSQYLLLAGGTMTGDIDMGTNKVTNAAEPTAAGDYATKGYVDAIVSNVHPACTAATTANLAGYTYDNGTAGVGATLTAGSNGAFTTDGVSPALNDRILVAFQTSAPENGIYTLSTVGDGSTAAVLTRATDYNEASEMDAGDLVSVVQGTLYGVTEWMMTQTAAITVGITDITWAERSVSGALLSANNLSDVNNAATSRQNLGVEIGVDVQAWDAGLDDIAALAATNGNFIVGDGTNWVPESGATARTSLGLGTIATQDANAVDIDGGTIDGTTIGGTAPAVGSFTQTNTDNIRIDGNTVSSTNTNGDINLDPNGTGEVDLYAGINFTNVSASGDAETLDDYEEGTFTPEVADAPSGGNTGTASEIIGSYTKIGRKVTLIMRLININTSGMTAGNNFYIRNFPFITQSSFNNQGSIQVGNITFAGKYLQFSGDIASAHGRIGMMSSGASSTSLLVSALTSGSAVVLTTLTYFI